MTDAPTTAADGAVTSPAGSGDGRERRVDASMSLLVDMMANTLDEAYAERAAGRRATPHPGAAPPVHRRSRWLPLVGLIVVGVVTGTAIASVRAREVETRGVRAGLAQEVRDRTARSDALAVRAAALRDEVAAARQQALGSDAEGRELARRVAALEAASATAAVRGPGVVVTVDDADAGDDAAPDALRGGTVPEGRVSDRDLQDVVNGLWAAGAEAVAVNGQRLGPLTAIRSAGDAVLVDLRPLSPPYVVEAVGDPGDLQVDFVDGPSGRRLATLASLYGIEFDVERADALTLAGAPAPQLRAAVSQAGARS